MLNRYIFALSLLCTMAACRDGISVSPVAFEVSSDKSSITLGDTVNFTFTGNPDGITFYSGEIGHRYAYRDRTTAEGTPVLQFSSLRANGSQAGSLALLVSADFKGAVLKTVNGSTVRDTAATNANIAAATWQDITGRATLSTGGSTAVASGNIDLSDFDKPVYIAFRYTATAGSVQNKWTISALTLELIS